MGYRNIWNMYVEKETRHYSRIILLAKFMNPRYAWIVARLIRRQ